MRGARHPNGIAGTGFLLARPDDDCGPVARCGRATIERPQSMTPNMIAIPAAIIAWDNMPNC